MTVLKNGFALLCVCGSIFLWFANQSDTNWSEKLENDMTAVCPGLGLKQFGLRFKGA